MRPRRHVYRPVLRVARPLLRFSYTRDAYVLKLVGDQYGPVLKPRKRRIARRG